MVPSKNRYLALFIIAFMAMTSAVLYLFFNSEKGASMCRENREQLSRLDYISERRLYFRDSLKHVLDSTMLHLHRNLSLSDIQRYEINKHGLEMSVMFSFDYASQFASKLILISDRIADRNLIVESRAMSSFYLAQACLFVEALNTLHSVSPDTDSISDQVRSKYYFCYAICYQRMAVYVNDSVNSNKYNRLGENMFRKCIQYTDHPGIRHFAEGRICERAGDMKSAQVHYEKALKSLPQEDYLIQSLVLSSLAKSLKHQGLCEEAAPYYMKATELDIRQSHNSSIAIIDLAEHLYNHYGNTHDSGRYMEMAIDNGEYYGMRSQVTRVDRMIPKLTQIRERQRITFLVATIGVLVMLLVVVIVLMLRYRKARIVLLQSQMTNTENTCLNTKLASENDLLNEENIRLSEENSKLAASNKIKNEYIGSLMETNSELATMVEDFAKKAHQKLKIGNYEQVGKMLVELESHVNKKENLARFDETVLSMFPDFVNQFNALLKPDKQELPSKDSLTPTIRIFALVRLGVKENQQIARILNYSYNTILNYRVRARGNSINPEMFEKEIKSIGRGF